MKRSTLGLAFSLVLGLGATGLAGGCSDGGAKGGGGGMGGGTDGEGTAASSVTVQDYCERKIALEEPWCKYIDDCCIEADKSDLNFLVPTCSLGRKSVDECVASIQTVLDAGATFDGSFVDSCLEDVKATIPDPPSTCSGLAATQWLLNGRELPGYTKSTACQNMYVGKTKQDEPCDYDAQCVSGTVCRDPDGINFVCAPPLTEGQKCLLSSSCAGDLICVEGPLGRACGRPAAEGGDCLYGSDCLDGLVCSAGKCAVPLELGDQCGFDETCEYGAGCSLGYSMCVSLGNPGFGCTTSANCKGRCDTDTGECVDICGGVYY